MDAETLRSQQAPIKARYREDATSASITLRSVGTLGEGITCRLETSRGRIDAGLHPATGGDGLSACSGDMLLEALVGCAGVTLNAVATALEIPIRGGTVTAEGDLDVRGTLGIRKDVPVGFREIRLRFDLHADATEEQLATLLKLTERYCVIYQTLVRSPDMKASMIRTDDPDDLISSRPVAGREG
ncbi:OsmC family protein [Tundrisphaera lichenicola]|uniref:OsmC family protein n=1 Tax=Tundrisphaera lichenicola TaxID=2029860 RepID=UPI003EBD05A3